MYLMNGFNDVINILQTCQHVAIAFLILFFIISIVLFLLFDIRKIFNIRTGRAKAKTVSEMSKANAATGRLRVGGKTVTSELSKDEKKNKKKQKTDNYAIPPQQTPVPQPNTQYSAPPQSYGFDGASMPTEKLTDDGTDATTVLESSTPDYPARKFVITKKVISVNTSETIS